MLKAKLYKAPNGHIDDIYITEVNPEDAQFFLENNLQLSMEEVPGFLLAVYCTLIDKQDDKDNEIVYLVPHGEDCRTALSKVRQMVLEESSNE